MALIAAVYGRVAGHGFVYLDDDAYVFANEVVSRGLTLDGVAWSYTHFHATNWHPLTWISHMIDSQLFGAGPADAGGHHLVSVGLHAASAILLFIALRRMTGTRWPAAFVAALFAVHPLRVESVAWVSERKDVLSGFFFMLTLLAYQRYVRRPGAASYLMVLSTTLLGLLSKPMLVTLPVVLLLLDYWPLRRFAHGGRAASPPVRARGDRGPLTRSPRYLVAEKLPLLAAAAGVSLLTLRAQAAGGAISDLEVITIPWRLVTALIASVIYLWKTLWPSDLAVLYVHPATLPGADLREHAIPALLAALALAAVTVLAVRLRTRRPYLLTGWLWYLAMLAPVSGLVSVGVHFWADRYAYLPLVGVYVMLVWGASEAVGRRPALRAGAGILAGLALAAYAAVAFVQVGKWRDSRTLFDHTLRVTRDNWMIENNLGYSLTVGDPTSPEARTRFERAIRIHPGYIDAHHNLAAMLVADGGDDEAARHWEAILKASPGTLKAHLGLGGVRVRQGRLEEARSHYEQAVKLDPANSEAHVDLGAMLAATGDPDAARGRFEEALRIEPYSVPALNALARLLATHPDSLKRDPERALSLAMRVGAQTQYRRPEILATIAAAHAAAADHAQAVVWQRRALALAPERSRETYTERLRVYEERERAGSSR